MPSKPQPGPADAGRLFVVATPIGNLEDLSDRAKRTLAEVDAIACEDTRSARKLLSHLKLKASLISLHKQNEAERCDSICKRLKQGEKIALVSEAGTPTLSDPGARLIAQCYAGDLAVSPIPGPSAVTTALSASGFGADQFSFLGFLPRKGQERQRCLQEMAAATHATVFFEAPNRVQATLKDLAEVLPGQREIVIGREITKMYESFRRLSLTEWLQDLPPARGEFTLVVAPATDVQKRQLILERYQFLKQHTSMKDQEICKLIAMEFTTNPKRIAYQIKELTKPLSNG